MSVARRPVYIIIGAGNLTDEIAQLVDQIVACGLASRQTMRLHLHVLEDLLLPGSDAPRTIAMMLFCERSRASNSFPGSAWERVAPQALPASRSQKGKGKSERKREKGEEQWKGRRSLQDSAFPGGAWERGNQGLALLPVANNGSFRITN